MIVDMRALHIAIFAVLLGGCTEAVGVEPIVVDLETDQAQYAVGATGELLVSNRGPATVLHDGIECAVIERLAGDDWSPIGTNDPGACTLAPRPDVELQAGQAITGPFGVDWRYDPGSTYRLAVMFQSGSTTEWSFSNAFTVTAAEAGG